MGGVLRPLAAVLGAVLLLAGCTGDDEPDDGPDARSSGGTSATAAPVAAWPEAWRRDAPAGGHAANAVVELADSWVDGDDLVVDGGGRLLVLDLTSGAVRREIPLPRGQVACAMSPSLGADGVGVLLLGPRGRSSCTSVVAVDTRTGRLRWSRSVGTQDTGLGPFSVSVGQRVVVATLSCGQTRRWRLRDGATLEPLLVRDRSCSHSAVHDGRLVLAFDDPVTARTPAGLDGWIPPGPEEGAFELYDQDTGRLLGRRPAASRARFRAVVSSDPLVVQESYRGHDLLQAYDERGRPTHVVGQPLGFGNGTLHVVGGEDGRLAVTYPFGVSPGTVYVYDLATGEEVGHVALGPGSSPAGLHDGDVLVVRSGWAGEDGDLLTRVDPATGEEGVLGSGHVAALATLVVGDRLIAMSRDGGAFAVDLTRDDLRAVDTVDRPAVLDAELDWQEGEVRPDEDDLTRTEAVCQEVSDGTLRLLAFRRDDLAAPSDCHWSETDEPDHARRELRVHTTLSRPGDGGPDRSATEAAEAAYDQAVTEERDAGPWTPLSGFGDEAALATFTAADAESSQTSLVVRSHNVVVTVEGVEDAELDDRAAGVVPPHVLHAGVVRAATEVLAALGLTVDPPPAVDPGAVTRVPDSCRALAAVGSAFTGARGRDTSPREADDGRRTGCVWQGRGDDAPSMSAGLYAATGDPTGLDAVAVARRIVASGQAGEKVRLGDQAKLWDFDSDDSDYRGRDLFVRRGNVVLHVSMTDPSAASPAALDAAVLDAGRRLLRAVRGAGG